MFFLSFENALFYLGGFTRGSGGGGGADEEPAGDWRTQKSAGKSDRDTKWRRDDNTPARRDDNTTARRDDTTAGGWRK